MPTIATRIKTNELCSYGCGEIAKYRNKAGKLMCCKHSNSCSAIRAKNSYGVANSGRDYKADYEKLPQHIKDNMAAANRGNFKNLKLLLISKRGHKCEMCANVEWLGSPIKLEMDHIDGDNTNDSDTNLRLLCPNCHSTTPTWRKKKNAKIHKQLYSDEEMLDAISISTNMNQCLRKLKLSWGSGETILKCMAKHKVNFGNVS